MSGDVRILLTEESVEAEGEGIAAFNAGLPFSSNPYAAPLSARQWRVGWCYARDKKLEREEDERSRYHRDYRNDWSDQ